jgi:hypothetical protein
LASGQELPAQDVQAFLANPAQLLQQNPDGGPTLISRIRDPAASDPATLWVIIRLLASGTANQKSAIGAGLGQAAQMCVRTDQVDAAEIQRQVGASGIEEAITAMAAVLGDRPIGGLGGGPGGGGGGSGGGGPITAFSVPFGPTGGATPVTAFSTTNTFGGFTGALEVLKERMLCS